MTQTQKRNAFIHSLAWDTVRVQLPQAVPIIKKYAYQRYPKKKR